MPTYGLPGVAAGRRTARTTGVLAMAAVVALGIGWRLAPAGTDANLLTIDLLTDRIGAGIGQGSDVRLDGVKVGAVGSIEGTAEGSQRIELELDRSQVSGLTDTMSIDFAPGNLFGVTEIEMQPAPGGATLVDGAVLDLTGEEQGRVDDATISTLLGSLGGFTSGVLTPKLTEVLRRMDIGATAFTPLFQSMVAMSRAVADTQVHPAPFLLREYGSALAGLPSTADGGIRLLDAAFDSEYMKSEENRTRFDATTSVFKDSLFPSLIPLLTTAQPNFEELAILIAPILDAIAATVPTPHTTGRDLGVLLDRLNEKFHDTSEGPVLNVEVDLSAIPALSGPLQAAVPAPVDRGR
ncbi:MAG: MlaD family protein [Rhodococcus sp. (in: high G+C Gram-positive bacteria)]